MHSCPARHTSCYDSYASRFLASYSMTKVSSTFHRLSATAHRYTHTHTQLASQRTTTSAAHQNTLPFHHAGQSSHRGNHELVTTHQSVANPMAGPLRGTFEQGHAAEFTCITTASTQTQQQHTTLLEARHSSQHNTLRVQVESHTHRAAHDFQPPTVP
jgi:hypothetical protein